MMDLLFNTQEDTLEEGMATHSSVVAWRIPMDTGAWCTTVHRITKSQTQLSSRAQTQAHLNPDWSPLKIHNHVYKDCFSKSGPLCRFWGLQLGHTLGAAIKPAKNDVVVLLKWYSFLKREYLLILFLAALGLCYFAWAFSSCLEWGLLCNCGAGFSCWGARALGRACFHSCAGSWSLPSLFSRCTNRGLRSSCGARASHCGGFICHGARALGTWASVVVACGLSCPMACGIFLD